MGFLPPLVVSIIICNLALVHGSAELIYEDGYTVTTVLDGNKLKINPHTLSPVPFPGFHDLLLLDSFHSRFYTISIPLSQESVIKEFAGNGLAGFSDGDASTAMFEKPKSFTVDLKGNVYVADQNKYAVRKISVSGAVTTIAGGYSKKAGRTDGPGRNATFSADYELTFVPDLCALLILDRGNMLIRQINLKQENCARTDSGVGVTVVWPWIAAVVVSCLAGILVGFIIHPYIMRHEVLNFLNISKSWTCYLMNLGSQTRMICFGTRSAAASPTLKFMRGVAMLVFSQLSLLLAFMFKRSNSRYSTVDKDYVSLLDSDNSGSSRCVSSQKYDDQLKDLISLSGDWGTSKECTDDSLKEVEKDHHGQINDLMQASMANFAEDACKSRAFEGPFLGVSTVVRRR